MAVQPSEAEFAAAFKEGRPQVVWTHLVADLETPVSAMLKLADCRLKQNKREKARALYATLINTYPGTTAAHEASERLGKFTQ